MNEKKKAIFNWSGGKDSALALLKTLRGDEFDVIALLTTINGDTNTSSIHATPLELLTRQAESIGIPLFPVMLSKVEGSYEREMGEAVGHFQNLGVKHFIFGDIFLEEVRQYRERKLNPLGIEVVEPLWELRSEEVMDEFLASGLKTVVIVTDAALLDKTFIGRTIDESFLNDLPPGVDVCGENGEFHTFSYEGPLFKKDVDFTITDVELTTHEFKLDSGELKRHQYWQAKLIL